MQWGISPEIYIGKNLANPPEGAIITAGGGCFYSKEGKPPILKEVLTSLYAMRRSAKKKYQECESKIIELEEILKNK
jgi:hypothetical protein